MNLISTPLGMSQSFSTDTAGGCVTSYNSYTDFLLSVKETSQRSGRVRGAVSSFAGKILTLLDIGLGFEALFSVKKNRNL